MGGAGITRIEAFLILEIGIFLFIRIDWPGGGRESVAAFQCCTHKRVFQCVSLHLFRNAWLSELTPVPVV